MESREPTYKVCSLSLLVSMQIDVIGIVEAGIVCRSLPVLRQKQ